MQHAAERSALVTGAASGIGAATARLLAERGFDRLILVDRDASRLDAVASALDCACTVAIGDVADEGFWDRIDLGGLTHAVVNAGIAAGGPVEQTSFEDWRRVMAVNLDGAFLTLRAAMRAIRAREGGGGAIVLTGSVAGVKAEPGTGAYGASKAALIHLAKIAAQEGAPAIRVNAIAPGGVETPIWSSQAFFRDLAARKGGEAAAFQALAGMATPLGRYATAEEIAAQIAFLLSDEAAFITGACLVSDGGYAK